MLKSEINALIKFAKWVNRNYTQLGQYWTPIVGQGKEVFIKSEELVFFYVYVMQHFRWEEEPGFWYNVHFDYSPSFTLKEVYDIYKMNYVNGNK